MDEEVQSIEQCFIKEEEVPFEDRDESFNRQRTLKLINLYQKYRHKVGTFAVKSLKRMWVVIANEMQKDWKGCTANKCENKWKVLERNYKRVVDNNRKTGRRRKLFEFEKQFDVIYGKKGNVNPKGSSEVVIQNTNKASVVGPSTSKITVPSVILRSSETCVQNTKEDLVVGSSPSEQVKVPFTLPSRPTLLYIQQSKATVSKNTNNTDHTAATSPIRNRKHNIYKKRNDILTSMKNDLKSYYENTLEIENRRLELQDLKMQDRLRRTEIFENYVAELRKINESKKDSCIILAPPSDFL